jgi:hypothetical protein
VRPAEDGASIDPGVCLGRERIDCIEAPALIAVKGQHAESDAVVRLGVAVRRQRGGADLRHRVVMSSMLAMALATSACGPTSSPRLATSACGPTSSPRVNITSFELTCQASMRTIWSRNCFIYAARTRARVAQIEAEHVFALDPMSFAVQKGADIRADGIAIIGPCWGPDFHDAVVKAAGLSANKKQRSLVTSGWEFSR